MIFSCVVRTVKAMFAFSSCFLASAQFDLPSVGMARLDVEVPFVEALVSRDRPNFWKFIPTTELLCDDRPRVASEASGSVSVAL